MMNIHISDRFMLKYLHLASECNIEDKLNSIEFDYLSNRTMTKKKLSSEFGVI